MSQPKKIVSVRPTKQGKWEVVETTPMADRAWRIAWDRWYKAIGHRFERRAGWWVE